MKGDKDKTPEVEEPPKFERRSTGRRAAIIANTKIAASAKILASNKIIATAGLDRPTPKPRQRKNAAQKAGAASKASLTVVNPTAPPIRKLIPIAPAPSVPSFTYKPAIPTVKLTLTSALPQTQPVKRKSSSASTKNLGLIMECEDDDLSPIQWATYKRAENEYLDVLRKLTKWKSRSDVEIVHIDADGEIPPPPRFLTVTEASKLPLPSNLARINVGETLTENAASAFARLAPNSLPGNGFVTNQRVIVAPRSNFARATVDTNSQAAKPPIMTHEQKLVHLYGKPRRTSTKKYAATLFCNGRDLHEICNYLNVTRMVVEVFLIDSIFLQDTVDYMRLCHILGVTKPMMEHVNRIIKQQNDITLPKLQAQTMYTFNQIRLCIALLRRRLKWISPQPSPV